MWVTNGGGGGQPPGSAHNVLMSGTFLISHPYTGTHSSIASVTVSVLWAEDEIG